MNARIEKKLSKRLVEVAPNLFKDAWLSNDGKNVYCIGGGVDYWGEGQDEYTIWEWFKFNWYWLGDFPRHPEGHEFEFYPNTDGFNPTPTNLIKLAKAIG